jgi:hypothetical protein
MAAIMTTDLRHYPQETMIIGRLLSGYGELEFDIAFLLQFALGDDRDVAFKSLFGIRGETARIDVADNLMRRRYQAIGLGDDYAEAIGAMRYCLRIRNQYAHCHWVKNLTHGLCFVDVEEVARAASEVDLGALTQKHVSLALLSEQETFFAYAQAMFGFVNYAYRTAIGTMAINPMKRPNKPRERPCLFISTALGGADRIQ